MMNSYSSFLDSIFDFNFEDQLLGQHSILLGTQVIKGFFFFSNLFILFIILTDIVSFNYWFPTLDTDPPNPRR